jgi:hypothetical protein
MSCQNQKLFTLCEHLGSSPVCIWRSPYCSYFSLCSVLLFLFVFVLCRVKLSVSGWSSNSPLVYRPVWCVLKVVRVSEWSSNSPPVYCPVWCVLKVVRVSEWSSNSPLVYRPVWCVLKVVRVSEWSSNSPRVYRPVWCVLKVVRVSEWSSNSPLVYRPVYYFTYFVPVFKYCYSDSRNLWTVMRAGGLAP